MVTLDEVARMATALPEVTLRTATKTSVRDALLDAWLACAPAALAQAHLERSPRRR